MAEGRLISAVAADIADAGFAMYLSAKIAKGKEEAEERVVWDCQCARTAHSIA